MQQAQQAFQSFKQSLPPEVLRHVTKQVARTEADLDETIEKLRVTRFVTRFTYEHLEEKRP